MRHRTRHRRGRSVKSSRDKVQRSAGKFAGETRDAVAGDYPTAEEARITCAIVDTAAKVRDLNFKYLAKGKGATPAAAGPASAPTASPSWTQTARVKARRGCFRNFARRRFEPRMSADLRGRSGAQGNRSPRGCAHAGGDSPSLLDRGPGRGESDGRCQRKSPALGMNRAAPLIAVNRTTRRSWRTCRSFPTGAFVRVRSRRALWDRLP